MNIIILLFCILITAIITGVSIYFILKPRLVAAMEQDTITLQENEKLKEQYSLLFNENLNLINKKDFLTQETIELENNRNKLNAEKESIISNIEILNQSMQTTKNQAELAAQQFYDLEMELAQTKLNQDIINATKATQENIESFQTEYDEIVQDMLKEFRDLSNGVQEMKSTHAAAVEAAKRAEEMKTQTDFYRIQLSELDIKEIEALRSIEHLFRDSEPLNKVIWKCYYEKPTTDMIGRVVGNGTHTGIYKLTDIASGKCYVGQAANIADRWKQHIKRGVGAEAPTRNKLYPAMIAIGPENFTFEIIEECDRSLLDAREDYWQDYFKAKEFGYSIK